MENYSIERALFRDGNVCKEIHIKQINDSNKNFYKNKLFCINPRCNAQMEFRKNRFQSKKNCKKDHLISCRKYYSKCIIRESDVSNEKAERKIWSILRFIFLPKGTRISTKRYIKQKYEHSTHVKNYHCDNDNLLKIQKDECICVYGEVHRIHDQINHAYIAFESIKGYTCVSVKLNSFIIENGGREALEKMKERQQIASQQGEHLFCVCIGEATREKDRVIIHPKSMKRLYVIEKESFISDPDAFRH